MLYWVGAKRRLLTQLFDLFPKNKSTFIDMFMGSGVVTNAASKIYKNVIANDIDNNVYNLFLQLQNHREAFYNAIEEIPLHESIVKDWCRQEPKDDFERACKFVVISNYKFMATGHTLRATVNNHIKDVLANSIKTFIKTSNVLFLNKHFTKVMNAVSMRDDRREKNQCFIYADPPYIECSESKTYNTKWEIDDFHILLNLLKESGVDFAISETDRILKHIDLTGLNVIELKNIRHLNKRANEILITNYDCKQAELF